MSVAYPEGVLAGTVSKHYGLSSEMFSGSLFYNWYEVFLFPPSVKNISYFHSILLAIYAPLIYTSPCLMLLMRAASITRASGRDFQGPTPSYLPKE